MDELSSLIVGGVFGVVLCIYLGIVDPANSRDLRNDALLFEEAADSIAYYKKELNECRELKKGSEIEPPSYDEMLLLNLQPPKALPEFLGKPKKLSKPEVFGVPSDSL